MPPIGDPAALAAEVFKESKKSKMPSKAPAAKPAPGVPASDGAFIASPEVPGAPEIPPGEAAAAQVMFQAFEKKDAAMMARGMRDFFEICFPGLADMAKGDDETAEPGPYDDRDE